MKALGVQTDVEMTVLPRQQQVLRRKGICSLPSERPLGMCSRYVIDLMKIRVELSSNEVGLCVFLQ